MSTTEAAPPGATTANPERLRERLTDLIGSDRWVNSSHPAVAPASEEEVAKLLQGYPGEIMVIGSGTNFTADYNPSSDALILLTARLASHFIHSISDQTVEISAGLPVMDVRRRLAAVGQLVPSLERFQTGTIGGRLAATPSRPDGHLDGWAQSLLGLTVASPDGEILNFGGSCIKDVAGYDLRHLFTGSRGASGVILRAIFRCWPVEAWGTMHIEPSLPPAPGRSDPVWRKLLDPKGRMRPGV